MTNVRGGNVAVKEVPICPPDDLVDSLTVDRDPKRVNAWINIAFEDILAEPQSIHAATCLWQNSIRSYTGSKNCCYQFLSGLCGIFIACWYGLKFASIAFCKIWCCVPNLKLTLFVCGFAATAFRKLTYLCCFACHFVSSPNEEEGRYCCESCCCCAPGCCHRGGAGPSGGKGAAPNANGGWN